MWLWVQLWMQMQVQMWVQAWVQVRVPGQKQPPRGRGWAGRQCSAAAAAAARCPEPHPTSHLRPLPRHLPPSRSQVFIATNTCRTQPAYGRAMAALLENLDAFTTAATMAQALPALHGHSYLDIASMRCQEEPGRSRGGVGRWERAGMGLAQMPPWWWLDVHQCRGGFLLADTLTPISPELTPEMPMPGNMTVRLVVECRKPRCPQHQLYNWPVPAPAGASLLDVLRAATVQGHHNFTYVASRARVGGPSGVPACRTRGGHVPCTHATGSPRFPVPGSLGSSSAPLPAVPRLGPHPPLPPTRFDTQDTPQGPFLSRVLGLEAQQQKRSYWQLLTAPSTSLQMGE